MPHTPMITRLLEHVRPRYDGHGDAGHDFNHIRRVVAACEKFGRELGARLDLLLPAAILHDIVNVPKNSPDRIKASGIAAEEATRILLEPSIVGTEGTEGPQLTRDDVARVAQIIVEHSFSLGLKPSSIESAILQDADKLDAIGAIGVVRTFTCGQKMGTLYYHPEDPWGEARGLAGLDDKKYTIDHFAVKLRRLEAMMNTAPARAEARRRAEYMDGFLREFRRELGFGTRA